MMSERKLSDISKIYVDIKEIVENSDLTFDEFCKSMLIMEDVLKEVTMLFQNNIINLSNDVLIQSIEKQLDILIGQLRDGIINSSKQLGVPPNLITVSEVVEIITDMYIIIFEQIFNDDYINLIIKPSLLDIGNVIIETTENQVVEDTDG